MTIVPMRANTSMKVAASTGRKEMSMRMRASPQYSVISNQKDAAPITDH
jgi:hypothetical protein